jgi:hypothetical protein
MPGDRDTRPPNNGAGPSTFSVYASRFLSGNGNGNKEEVRSSQVSQRSASPSSMHSFNTIHVVLVQIEAGFLCLFTVKLD